MGQTVQLAFTNRTDACSWAVSTSDTATWVNPPFASGLC